MPSHSHNVGTSGNGASGAPYDKFVSSTLGNLVATSSIGGGGAHNNIQPSQVIRYIVKA